MFEYNLDTREILIYDEIGPSWLGLIGAESISLALTELGPGDITVRLNTPGGSVDEGIAMYNALKRHAGKVTTIADSLAASMGSYLLQAGSLRKVASNAMVMLHNPWSIAVGDSAEFRKQADILDKYRDRMVPDYAEASGNTPEEMQAILNAETWFTGAEAVEAGFADEVDSVAEQEVTQEALLALNRIAKNIPKGLKAKAKTAAPKRSQAAAKLKAIKHSATLTPK